MLSIPTLFKETSIKDHNLKTLAWNNFKETGHDSIKFQCLKTENETFKHENLLRIPHALALALLSSPEKDPSSVYELKN